MPFEVESCYINMLVIIFISES